MRRYIFNERDREILFQSTHPVRGATSAAASPRAPSRISIHAPRAGCDRNIAFNSARGNDFNPRTPCGVRPTGWNFRIRKHFISIHAPRAGCDRQEQRRDFCRYISIHAPRAGCDITVVVFLRDGNHFNPRTPCGVRHAAKLPQYQPNRFQSTHPVRGATVLWLQDNSMKAFQSTHPVRGATMKMADTLTTKLISIHAPRAGCDPYSRTASTAY